MITITNLVFDPPVTFSGLGFSASGMSLTIASGSVGDSNFSSFTTTITPPASGQSCFSIWQITETDSYVATPELGILEEFPTALKIAWLYVSSDDTSLENKEVFRYLYDNA